MKPLSRNLYNSSGHPRLYFAMLRSSRCSLGVVTLALKIALKLDIVFFVVPVYGPYKLFSKKENSAAVNFVLSPQNIK